MNQDPMMTRALFEHLVATLATSAMQQLGKLVNPMTRKAEVNLDGAQAAIDMLDMLATRTKGNLEKEESDMLTSTISMLQLNYFETAKATPAAAAETASGIAPPPTTEPPHDDNKIRFEKKYE